MSRYSYFQKAQQQISRISTKKSAESAAKVIKLMEQEEEETRRSFADFLVAFNICAREIEEAIASENELTARIEERSVTITAFGAKILSVEIDLVGSGALISFKSFLNSLSYSTTVRLSDKEIVAHNHNAVVGIGVVSTSEITIPGEGIRTFETALGLVATNVGKLIGLVIAAHKTE